MPRIDKDLVLTILVVECAVVAMFFGLKVDHDTLERELEVARQYEAANPDFLDYRILNNTSIAQPVREDVGNPMFDSAIEHMISK